MQVTPWQENLNRVIARAERDGDDPASCIAEDHGHTPAEILDALATLSTMGTEPIAAPRRDGEFDAHGKSVDELLVVLFRGFPTDRLTALRALTSRLDDYFEESGEALFEQALDADAEMVAGEQESNYLRSLGV